MDSEMLAVLVAGRKSGRPVLACLGQRSREVGPENVGRIELRPYRQSIQTLLLLGRNKKLWRNARWMIFRAGKKDDSKRAR